MSAFSMRDASLALASMLEVKCRVRSSVQVSKSKMGLILDLNTFTRPDILDQQKQKVPVHLDMSRGLVKNRLLDAIFLPGCQSLGQWFE